MKAFNIILLVTNVAMVIIGFVLFKSVSLGSAIVPWGIAALVFMIYIFRVKLLPFVRTRQQILDLANNAGFEPLPEHTADDIVARLCSFQRFAEASLGVRDVSILALPGGEILLGGYVSTGPNFNLGYFLLAAFDVPDRETVTDDTQDVRDTVGTVSTTGIAADIVCLKIEDRLPPMTESDEDALREIPPPLRSSLGDLPFDFEIREGKLLVDLDSRQLRTDDLAAALQPVIDGCVDLMT